MRILMNFKKCIEDGYYHPEDIEVKKKSDIEDYIEYLKENGFTEME